MRFSIGTKAATTRGGDTGRSGVTLFRPEAAQKANRPYKDGWSIERSIQTGLTRSVWVYRSVMAIATNQAKLPFVEREGDWYEGDIVKKSKVAATLNANVTGQTAVNATIFRRMMSMQYLLNTQGAMVEVINTKAGALYSLNLLPPNYTAPEPDPVEFIKRWVIEYPGTEKRYLQRDDVIWVREPHPTDYYSGMTPLQAAGISIEMDWYARLWNRNFILNDGRPAAIVAVKGEVDDDVADDILRRIGGGGGPNSAGKMIVLETDEGADLLEFGSNPRDAQYIEMRKAVKDEVLQCFGVPESVAGNASQRTFANADAELEVFWRETMVPHLEGIARSFDVLTPRDDRFISFDWSRVPILERDARDKRTFYLQEYQAGVRSQAEYRKVAPDMDGPGFGNVTRLYRSVGFQETGDTDDPNWVDPAQAQMGGGVDQFGNPIDPTQGQVDENGNPIEGAPGEGAPTGSEGAPAGDAGTPDWLTNGSTRPTSQATDRGSTWLDEILNTPAAKRLGVTSVKEYTDPVEDQAQHGIMVALCPPPDADAGIRADVPETSQIDDRLHITLCYLGKDYDDSAPDESTLLAAVAAWCSITGPFDITVGGLSKFPENEDGQDCYWAPVDAAPLQRFRETLVRVLDMAGVEVSSKYPDYTPHMTLCYLPPNADAPKPLTPTTWTCESVWVTYGPEWVELPLRGETMDYSDIKAAPKPENDTDTWLAWHGAWENTAAQVFDNHFDRERRVVTEKLTGRKSRQRYEAHLAEQSE